MARIVVLGAGVMGSAMAMPADANGHETALVGTHLDDDIIRSIAGNGHHPKLKVTLPESVTAYRWTEFESALDDGADLIVLGVSSAGVDWALDRLSEALSEPKPILMVTKGLVAAEDELDILPHHVARVLKTRLGFDMPVMAVGGPAIAGEQAARRDTSVVYTGTDTDAVEAAIGLFGARFYHLKRADDVIGVEVCAATKNLFALGVGTAAGRLEREGATENGTLMHNVAAGLFTQALIEMRRLVAALGGDPRTVDGLAGTGDLYVTCQAGRNSRMGRLIGLGIPYSTAKAEHMAADTVEGADLALAIAPALEKMFEDDRLNAEHLPMTRAILDAVCNDQEFTADWARFYT